MDTHTIYRVQALLQEAYELLDILYAQHPANLTPSTVVNPPAFNLDAMVETATAKVQDFINGQAYLAQRDIINACQEAMLKSNQRHDAYLVENFPKCSLHVGGPVALAALPTLWSSPCG